MKRSLVLAAFMVFSAAGALMGAPAAHAASAYDDLIQTTDKMTLCSNHNLPSKCDSQSKQYNAEAIGGTNWANLFTNMDDMTGPDNEKIPMDWRNDDKPDYKYAWEQKQHWAVTYEDIGNANNDSPQVTVTWTDDPNATVEFITDDPDSFLSYNVHRGYKYYRVSYYLTYIQSDYTIDYTKPHFNIDTYQTAGTDSPEISTTIVRTVGGYKLYKVFFINTTIVYPQDYLGVQPPDSAPREKEKSDVVPDMYVASSTNWLATFYDTRFYTFDNVSWTCSDGLVPVLHLEVWDMNKTPEVLLASNTSSASSEWTYQFQKSTQNQNYRLVSWYECGDEPEFTQSGTYNFTISGAGTLQTIGLETCLKPDFPWLDMNSCISGMNETLALLTFQRLNPVNDSVKAGASTSGCHKLGTLGDWIHQSGKTVCPAFSESVRNTLTPFAVLVVAMMTFAIVVVARKARWD